MGFEWITALIGLIPVAFYMDLSAQCWQEIWKGIKKNQIKIQAGNTADEINADLDYIMVGVTIFCMIMPVGVFLATSFEAVAQCISSKIMQSVVLVSGMAIIIFAPLYHGLKRKKEGR